jgi:NAD(P)-dependent dehydrogenase (short-subunit alcohol dehydrogenase family)
MALSEDLRRRFEITGRVAVITGGAGFLGQQHAHAILGAGGIPVLVDLADREPMAAASALTREAQSPVWGYPCDITSPDDVQRLTQWVTDSLGRVDILINNAANNPRMEGNTDQNWSRLESFPLDLWEADLAVGLTGAFLCSQALGAAMARRGKGVILNIASDLAVIAPDQRIYRQSGLPEESQPAKPITYSVVKSGLIGMTRWLATWWAAQGVRVNALSPGGVANEQPEQFVERLVSLIPMGRMAAADEYRAAVLFLCSDASSYMTGANLLIEGGRTAW